MNRASRRPACERARSRSQGQMCLPLPSPLTWSTSSNEAASARHRLRWPVTLARSRPGRWTSEREQRVACPALAKARQERDHEQEVEALVGVLRQLEDVEQRGRHSEIESDTKDRPDHRTQRPQEDRVAAADVVVETELARPDPC